MNKGVAGDPRPSTITEREPRVVNRNRARVVHFSLVVFALAIIAKSAQLQIYEGAYWTAEAQRLQVRVRDVPAERGRILDASGEVLVETREFMQLNITPANIKPNLQFPDARAAVRAELAWLGVPSALIRKSLDTKQKSVLLPGLYRRDQVAKVASMPGVDLDRRLVRDVSAPPGLLGILGTVSHNGAVAGGIEQEFDELLRGESGKRSLLRDGTGRLLESPQLSETPARAGYSVTLTLSKSLQEIAERELAAAMQRTGASGGDVVMLDPRDGAVLVLAGARNFRISGGSSTPLSEAYQPGSVMKPFLVAKLLDNGRVRESDVINTEDGKYTIGRRTITDEHKAQSMTVRDVVRLSSNIGVAKLSQLVSWREQFEALRDFGFGMATAVPYPAESRGHLATPASWTSMSPASLAMGYEVSATALQLAAAYATLANGGELLQPALIKHLHDPDGNMVFRHTRRVVRRVISEETALRMRTILQSVVDSGTATAATLTSFDVAGKSGTAKRYIGRSYSTGDYNSTFAGMFPAQAPQYVFVARLIDPRGKYYGGVVSGEMVNRILQAAIVTADVSLDHRALAAVARPYSPRNEKRLAMGRERSLTHSQRVAISGSDSVSPDALSSAALAPLEVVDASVRIVVSLPLARGNAASIESDPRASISSGLNARSDTDRTVMVPSISGLDVRQATRVLNSAGFQVKLLKGIEGRTRPATGERARVGSTIVLETAQ